jgi:hypothetical protein
MAAALVAVAFAPQAPVALAAQSDLDAFMGEVLLKRDENWKKLQQYILDERERIEMRGPGGLPLWGQRREYRWFTRDGYFIRSPLSADGVKVSESDQKKYEDDYLRRVKERDRRAARGRGAGPGAGDPPAPDDPASAIAAPATVEGLLSQTRQPQFIDSAYFLRFKFEQGRYAFVGRETFDGREVLRIEYYPARLFSNDQDAAARRRDAGRPDANRDTEAAIERLLNKNSMVTLWVAPADKQIVRYTFDNVHLDFLPAAWLVHLDHLRATMTMGQPFKDVWLPRDVELNLAAMIALGQLDIRFRIDYVDYREAATTARIKKGEGGRP